MLCAKGNLLDAAAKYRKRRRRERQTDRQTQRKERLPMHGSLYGPLWCRCPKRRKNMKNKKKMNIRTRQQVLNASDY